MEDNNLIKNYDEKDAIEESNPIQEYKRKENKVEPIKNREEIENKIKERMLKIYNQEELNQENVIDIIYYDELEIAKENNKDGVGEIGACVERFKDKENNILCNLYMDYMLIGRTDKSGRLVLTPEYINYYADKDSRMFEALKTRNPNSIFKIKELKDMDLQIGKTELEQMQQKQIEQEKRNENTSSLEMNEEKKKEEVKKEEEILGENVKDDNSVIELDGSQRLTETKTVKQLLGYDKVKIRFNSLGQAVAIGINSDGSVEEIEGVTRVKMEEKANAALIEKGEGGNRYNPEIKQGQHIDDILQIGDEGEGIGIENGKITQQPKAYFARKAANNKQWVLEEIATDKKQENEIPKTNMLDENRTSDERLKKLSREIQHQTGESEEHVVNVSLVDENPNNDRIERHMYDKQIKVNGEETTIQEQADENGKDVDLYVSELENSKEDCIPEKINDVNDKEAESVDWDKVIESNPRLQELSNDFSKERMKDLLKNESGSVEERTEKIITELSGQLKNEQTYYQSKERGERINPNSNE